MTTTAKSDRIRLACYCLALLLMAAYPVRKIIAFEWPSAKPRQVLLPILLRDPYDPMRGRYVALSFDDIVELPKSDDPSKQDIHALDGECFAVLKCDDKGVASIAALVKRLEDVPDGMIGLKVRQRHAFFSKENAEGPEVERHFIDFPIKRFFVNEEIAPEAEKLVWATEAGRILLRLNVYEDGSCTGDELLLDGKPLRNLI